MATSNGVMVGADGNLYELFSDGSRVLKEAGYQKRMDAYVAQLNATVNRPGAVTTTSSSVTTTTTTTPAVAPTPATATTTAAAATTSASQVKTATKDIILFNDESFPVSLMADLIFEDIGGEELISIARRDTVNGQDITYQPIKNLSSIEQQYNPNNIVSLQATADKYFANFPIKLDNKIPEEGTGVDGNYIYIDPLTGNLVIEAVNLEPEELIEIQIATSGTIYETDFNEGVS